MPPSARAMAQVAVALKSTADPTRKLVRRPRFRRAVASGLGAVAVLVAGPIVDHSVRRTLSAHLTAAGFTIGFLILAVLCVRSLASELEELIAWRGGRTAGSAVRMMATIFGYLMAFLGALDLLSVPVGHLLVGGAIFGVVMGIAAQQSLGNVFAGLVLLVAHPFAVGEHIRVRSGSLGGEFYGTVVSMTLTYVAIATDEGLLKVPNSGVLASAVGPWGHSPTSASEFHSPVAEEATRLVSSHRETARSN
ncbi:MAG TPA: mechanosensitive ion channel domain-containing protein [Acidimicrobiales bacterium]